MLKSKLLGLVMASTMVLMPAFSALPVSAATATNLQFGANPLLEAGTNQDVTATVRFTIPVNEEIEYIESDFLGDSRPPVCHNVNDEFGPSVEFFNLDELTPQTSNNYDYKVRAFGVDGAPAANGCALNSEVIETHTFVGQVVISDEDNQTTGPGGPSTAPSPAPSSGSQNSSTTEALNKISETLNAIMLFLQGGAPGNSSQICSQLQGYAGFYYGMRGPQIAQAQAFLQANGGFIPALSSGAASPGFWGNQSANAYWQVRSAHNCH